MARKVLQLYRGTKAQNDSFTGQPGELSVDITNNQLRLHDGTTKGGHIIGKHSAKIDNYNPDSEVEEVKPWIGTYEQYQDQQIEEEHPDYITFITDDEPGESQECEIIEFPARNIGDIFFTTRLDVKLNGAVECDGDSYYISDYEGVDTIGELLLNDRIPYVSLEDYETEIASKGWCDKFGWNGGTSKIFKVPTLTYKIIQENNIPVVGNGDTLGFISGSNKAVLNSHNEQLGNNNGWVKTHVGGSPTSIGDLKVQTDPEKSGLVANASSVSANLRVMVQLANGFIDEATEKSDNDLFDVKWSDHLVKNLAWVRADNFEWQSGEIYRAAYKHLERDYDNIEKAHYYHWASAAQENNYCWTESRYPEVGDIIYYNLNDLTQTGEVTAYNSSTDMVSILYNGNNLNNIPYVDETNVGAQTETISGTTIEYYLAEDGHKIVLPEQESNVSSIYNSTGVAWYYILDTQNKRFKLPRTQFAFTGIRDNVGKYIEPGLPNIVGTFGAGCYNTKASGAVTYTGESSVTDYGGQYTHSVGSFRLDASNSSSIYGGSTTVQTPATQMYLYFYIGQFTQTAIKNAAQFNVNLLNQKVNIGHEVIEFQVPTAENSYTWYRKYADGWVEQGGIQSIPASWTDVSLPIEMLNSHYTLSLTPSDNGDTGILCASYYTRTANDFKCAIGYNGTLYTGYVNWEVKGMAAQ